LHEGPTERRQSGALCTAIVCGPRVAGTVLIVVGFVVYLFVVGILAGFVARLFVPGHDRIGFWRTVLLGVVGSFIGGFLGYVLFGKDPGEGALQTSGIFGSVIGAVIALLLYRAVTGRRGIVRRGVFGRNVFRKSVFRR
jgi:uncharacterized membrane protein YeaQ/YmgE (transglycosylase-associated protein family)